MKKSLLTIFMVLMMVLLCSCGADSNNDTNLLDNHEDISSGTASASVNSNQENEKTSHYEYTHSALEGCVIVSSDRLTGECIYKARCPVCGKTSSGQTSTYLKSGTFVSGATCQNVQCTNWGKHFDVKVGATAQLVDD